MQDELKPLRDTLASAARKLKGGMDDGPFGPDVRITTTEACVLYRVLTEHMGLSFLE